MHVILSTRQEKGFRVPSYSIALLVFGPPGFRRESLLSAKTPFSWLVARYLLSLGCRALGCPTRKELIHVRL